MPLNVSAWTPLANITLSATASSVVFSNISQSYRDLVIVCAVQNDFNNGSLYMRFNGDSSNSYSSVWMYGDGSITSTSGNNTSSIWPSNLALSASPYNAIINVMDYSVTDKLKTAMGRLNHPGLASIAYYGRYNSTSAISSITLVPGAPGFVAGSSFALYGVSA